MRQAPSAQCNFAPFIEARLQAARSRYALVQVGYEKQQARPDCGATSQHVLAGHEPAIASTVADWLDGKEAPQAIDHANPQIAWREEVVTYPSPSAFGSNLVEATLLLPESSRFGAGPYPVLVFNHGDVEMDHPSIANKSRVRDLPLSREYLQLGAAVLLPLRKGVGMSEGTYPKEFFANDGDPIYKAHIDARDILPALSWLKTRAELDSNRLTLAGQSAGGYSAMYLASQPINGSIGAIDYAGGRTNLTAVSRVRPLNWMMVDGFAEFGKTPRVPTLRVFAENDSRYTVNTIRASHEAFQAVGGKAHLLLSPPIEGDNHNIYHKPLLWRAAVKAYLQEIGAVGMTSKTMGLLQRAGQQLLDRHYQNRSCSRSYLMGYSTNKYMKTGQYCLKQASSRAKNHFRTQKQADFGKKNSQCRLFTGASSY